MQQMEELQIQLAFFISDHTLMRDLIALLVNLQYFQEKIFAVKKKDVSIK